MEIINFRKILCEVHLKTFSVEMPWSVLALGDTGKPFQVCVKQLPGVHQLKLALQLQIIFQLFSSLQQQAVAYFTIRQRVLNVHRGKNIMVCNFHRL